jgi:hypothetical protein
MARKDGWVARADTELDWDEDVATARVELEVLPGWEIDVEVVGIRAGVPLLRAVRLRAPDGQPVTTRKLGAVPTGAVLRAVADDLAELLDGGGGMSASPGMTREISGWLDGLRETSNRPANPEVFYAQLAVEYERAAQASSSPTKDLAAKYDVTYSRMKNLLSEAVYRDLLVRGGRGLAGGRATDKAKELL